MQHGVHSPEGVPDALRREAGGHDLGGGGGPGGAGCPLLKHVILPANQGLASLSLPALNRRRPTCTCHPTLSCCSAAAVPVIDHIGDLLGAEAMAVRLVAHAEAAAAAHGSRSRAAQAVLDVCLHVLEGMSGLLEVCCSERVAGDPLPGWLAGMC